MRKKRETDAARYARVIAFVKKATGNTIGIEAVQAVQRGEHTESHPVSAAIYRALNR